VGQRSLQAPNSGETNIATNAPPSKITARVRPLNAGPPIASAWSGRRVIRIALQWALEANQNRLSIICRRVLKGFGAARPLPLPALGLGGLFSSSKSGSVITSQFLDAFVRNSLKRPGKAANQLCRKAALLRVARREVLRRAWAGARASRPSEYLRACHPMRFST
jgi:hypothetical protein